MKTPPREPLDKSIPSLLYGMNGILSSGAIAHILEADIAEVKLALSDLESDNVICRKQEHHEDGWTNTLETDHEPIKEYISDYYDSLLDYILLFPGATLSERMMVIRHGNASPRDQMYLLLGALRQARENGEFRLFSYFIREIMRPGLSSLTVSEAGEVLAMFEPLKLRDFEPAAAIEFIEGYLPSFKSVLDRVLALTRLGELEFVENRLPRSEKLLREALKLSMDNRTGDWIPEIFRSLAEIPGDFEEMRDTAALIEKVIEWLPEIDNDDVMVRILSTAAAALSELRMNSVAEMTILSAMKHIPAITLQTQQILEWCRAKVFIASGRKRSAMVMLNRSLLLAESVNDQFAVMEILNTIILEMKEHPDYTVRSLISIMQRVSKKASISGNLSNRLYSLDHLVDMYTRTLQISKALEAAERVSKIVDSSDMLEDEPRAAWFEAYISFLSGDGEGIGKGDLFLPGTGDFLLSLDREMEPFQEAGIIAEYLMASPGTDSTVCALILALEAFCSGYDKASSTIAAAVNSSYSSIHDNPFLSWDLCISGILASKDRHSDDFFHSAQLLARQLDRLLLVWLILRCRMRLEPDRGFREHSEILLLLAELDEHIAMQFSVEARNEFMKKTGAGQRLSKLRTDAECPEGTLNDIRNGLECKLENETSNVLREIHKGSGRISCRSEISSSLETLGILTGADRVLALRVRGSNLSIIEAYGPGGSKLPAAEIEEILLKLPEEEISLDNFGINPFGSRQSLIIPTEKSVIPAKLERRLHFLHSQRGNYLLIEHYSPFVQLDAPIKYFAECLCRQIGSALLLRDRESMAYIDTLTGSDIGYSWMKRLVTFRDSEKPPYANFSVLILDVDGMREINRLFGYRVGDNTLKMVVSTVREILRPSDLIGRLKEDMFGIILPETGEDNTIKIVERICSVVAGTDIRPDRVPVTVSVGAAVSRSSEESPELTCSRAYAALNKVKSLKSGRYVLWSAEEDLKGIDTGSLTVFSTGDPGWDYSVSVAIMDLLSEKNPSLEVMVEKLRDALRSEYIYLSDGNDRNTEIGSRIFRRIPDEVRESSTNRICLHSEILGRYTVLSVRLNSGGRLISAWEKVEAVSGSLRNVFRALASLSDMLIREGWERPDPETEKQL